MSNPEPDERSHAVLLIEELDGNIIYNLACARIGDGLRLVSEEEADTMVDYIRPQFRGVCVPIAAFYWEAPE